MIDLDEYHLDCLSKLRHKKWELFLIARIVHAIWDEGIEYTCQQYVKTGDDYRLADICFPSLGIWCEINEKGGHSSVDQQERDKRRMREIMQATHWRCVNFDAFYVKNGKAKPLAVLVEEVDHFISNLKSEFLNKLDNGQISKWSPADRYSPKKYANSTIIKVSDNVVFRYHKDALGLFGYTGGHHQASTWQTRRADCKVWFPKLYPNAGWDNSISQDGSVIKTRPIDSITRSSTKKPLNGYRIVFAHNTNVLGHTVYRFLGLFELASVVDSEETYRFVSDEIVLAEYS